MVIIYGEGGGVVNGRGGKRSFTLTNRGRGQKSFNAEKGGFKKVFELKYHVQSSDFYNHKEQKEDSENAISNNLETLNFPARRQPW